MNVKLLEDIGLTKAQAVAYKTLIQNGADTAPAIAQVIHESRTNTYKVLDKLCEQGLATKDRTGSKVRYYPASPAALEQVLQKRADEVELHTRKLAAELPNMLSFFFEHSEQPSVKYFQGEQGLYNAYLEQTRSKSPVYFIRSLQGIRYFGYDKAHRLRNLFPANGVVRYGIVQDINPPEAAPNDRMPVEESDKLMLLHRTWITTDDYNEPVEWVCYEDKLAIISFGEEVMGVTIQSKQIAQAFRKIYNLLSSNIQSRPNYKKLPKLSTYTRIPVSVSLLDKLDSGHQATNINK